MEKVAIYIRVSKKEQSQNKGSESSLTLQLKKCLDYCKEQGYEVLKVYSDVESGGNDDRKGFNELFESIPRKIYTKIVFWEISRIARKMSTGMKFFEELELYNISFDSISQPYVKDFMTLTIFMQMGTHEIKQMSLRIQSNLHEKTKAGYFVHGRPATGYVRGEKKMIVPDPIKAPMIKAIFETYASNFNLTETGRLFGKSRADITDIIDNRIYIGEVPYMKYVKEVDKKYRQRKRGKQIIWYKGLHEPIIPLELFEHCQSIRKSNIKARTNYDDYKLVLLFSSLITCPCGRKLYQNRSKYTSRRTGETKDVYAYQCGNPQCRKTISVKKIESIIIHKILHSQELEYINDLKVQEKNTDREIKVIAKELKGLEKERERVINLFQKGYLKEEELEEKFSNLRKRESALQEKKEEYALRKEKDVQTEIQNFEKLKFIIENYSEDDVVETRKILKLLIEEIKAISWNPLEIKISFF